MIISGPYLAEESRLKFHGNGPAVPVLSYGADFYGLAKYQSGRELLGLLAEVLNTFGTVYAEKAEKTHPPTAGLWTRKTEQGACQAPCFVDISWNENRMKAWLRGRDLNPRPLGYEPNELPDCSTPRHSVKYTRRPR